MSSDSAGVGVDAVRVAGRWVAYVDIVYGSAGVSGPGSASLVRLDARTGHSRTVHHYDNAGDAVVTVPTVVVAPDGPVAWWAQLARPDPVSGTNTVDSTINAWSRRLGPRVVDDGDLHDLTLHGHTLVWLNSKQRRTAILR